VSDKPLAWVVLAQLLRPQGRKGELLAELLTDFPERFDSHPRVYLAPANFTGEPAAAREAAVVSFWLPTGKNQGRVVLHFAGIDSINAAETLAGLEVLVPADERLPLDDESAYISELVGCVVYNHEPNNHEPNNQQPGAPGTPIGTVTDVHFSTTPDGGRRLEEAAPLLEVQSPAGHEILIPYVKAFLIALDVEAKTITMQLPAGLLELNQPG
jgi:16S rRNA processing protein RimM